MKFTSGYGRRSGRCEGHSSRIARDGDPGNLMNKKGIRETWTGGAHDAPSPCQTRCKGHAVAWEREGAVPVP